MSNIMTHSVILKAPLSKRRRILGQVPNVASKNFIFFMQNLEHFRILPVIFLIYHSSGSSLGNALQPEQPHLRKKILLDTLFQASPLFTRCCRKHASEIKHFLKSKTQGTNYTKTFSYFTHSENIWAKKSALRPESPIFIGRFNVSIRGKI